MRSSLILFALALIVGGLGYDHNGTVSDGKLGHNRTHTHMRNRTWCGGPAKNLTDYVKGKMRKDGRRKRGNIRSRFIASGSIDSSCSDDQAYAVSSRFSRGRRGRGRVTCEAASVAFTVTLEFETTDDNQTSVAEDMNEAIMDISEVLQDLDSASNMLGLTIETVPVVDVEVHDEDDEDLWNDVEYDHDSLEARYRRKHPDHHRVENDKSTDMMHLVLWPVVGGVIILIVAMAACAVVQKRQKSLAAAPKGVPAAQVVALSTPA